VNGSRVRRCLTADLARLTRPIAGQVLFGHREPVAPATAGVTAGPRAHPVLLTACGAADSVASMGPWPGRPMTP
jgi:hypothetical protein